MKPVRTRGLVPHFGRVLPDASKNADRYYREQQGKVLSNISFGTTTSNADQDMNMQVYKATGTSPGTANTAFVVNHLLPHIPFGFSIIRTNQASHIYDSGVAWTAATNSAFGTISLKADQASVVFTIIIY